MISLNVTRYEQGDSLCAVASCASIANFYNPSIDYKKTCKIAYQSFSDYINYAGIDSGEMGMLLNKLGFQKVSIISSNVNYLDYSWNKLSKKCLIETLKKTAKNKRAMYPETLRLFARFLSNFNNNSLLIDNNIAEYIKISLNNKKPVIITFNWNLMFKKPKMGRLNKPDPLGGCEQHAVVVYGYDDKDVYISDSNAASYKKGFKDYKNGKYKVDWNVLMLSMSMEDIIIAENYCELV